MQAALVDVHTLFLVSASEDANRVALHTTTVDAAVAAGVERIVYLSFYGASPGRDLHVRSRPLAHRAAHSRQRASGSSSFATTSTSTFCRASLAARGRARGPGGDGRVAGVARDDVADVAVTVLLDPSHARRPDVRPDRPAVDQPGRRGRGSRSRVGPPAAVSRRDPRGGLRITGALWRSALRGRRLGVGLRRDRERRAGARVAGRAAARRASRDQLSTISCASIRSRTRT